MTTLERAVVDLFEELERISLEHEEVTDTDVREQLYRALNYYFVCGGDRTRLPRSFEMFTREGDMLVANALCRFLDDAEKSQQLHTIPTGQARLDLLQAPGAKTTTGTRYDAFIGHGDAPLPADPLPEYMFREGEYEDDEE